MTNGKRKGDDFENRIARAMSMWLVAGDWATCHIDKLPFRRRYTASPSLEGFWIRGGDLLHRAAVKCPFSVECKNIEGWILDGAFSARKWKPWEWWAQCKAQARATARVPLLVFTRNRHPVYVLMAKETDECLGVKARSGPRVALVRPSGEALTLALLDDLVRVSRGRALRVKPLPLANAG